MRRVPIKLEGLVQDNLKDIADNQVVHETNHDLEAMHDFDNLLQVCGQG